MGGMVLSVALGTLSIASKGWGLVKVRLSDLQNLHDSG